MRKKRVIDAIGDMAFIAIEYVCLAVLLVAWAIEKVDDKMWALKRAL